MVRKQRSRFLMDQSEEFPSRIISIRERAAGTGSLTKVLRGKNKDIEYIQCAFWIVDDFGVNRRKYVYGKTESEALRKMDACLKETSSDITRTTTLRAFLERWLAKKKTEVARNTYAFYETTARVHIFPTSGNVKAKSLTSANARALLTRLEASGVGSTTRHNVYKVLSSAYSDAVESGVIAKNPMAIVKAPKIERKEQPILSLGEADELLKAASSTRYHALIRLALASGLRQGEMFALVVGDLRLNDRNPHLLVNATLTVGDGGALKRTKPKTESSRRRADLDARTAELLRPLIDGKANDEFVFTDTEGNPLRKSNFLRRVWHPMLRAAGLPKVHFHSLRHVANTHLLSSGAASILDLMARLGHSTPRMTLERYARVVPGVQPRIAATAGALFSDANGLSDAK